MAQPPTLYLQPSSDGVFRLSEALPTSAPVTTQSIPQTAMSPPKSNQLVAKPLQRKWSALLQEDWSQRLLNKPRALPKPGMPAENWLLPEFDLDIRTATVNDFIKLCGCGLVNEAATVLRAHPNLDLNAINDIGDTALHAACYHGHVDVVIMLLDQPSVDVNFENDAWRPIHIAADRGFLFILQLLISRGAEPNAPGQAGLTPLHLACLKGHTQIVEELVVANSVCLNLVTVGNRTVYDGRETALHLACMAGSFACADILLSTAQTEAYARTAMGWTALHIACEHGHTDIVELLLWYAKNNTALGIDVNALNCGWTPLLLACDEGHLEIVCLLLMCGGADPNFKAFGGYAALHVAAAQGHTDIVHVLLSRRTLDKNIRTDGGSTAFHIACETNRVDIVKALLQANADPHLATATGDTCLHTVAEKGFVNLWKMLIKHDMNPSLPNHAGVTPTDLASSKGNKNKPKPIESVGQAVQSGNHDAFDEMMATEASSVNIVDRDGRTPLHLAAEAGQYHMLARMLDVAGVNINTQTYTGNTVLHLAAALGHRKMVKRLLACRNINVSILNHGWTPVSLHNLVPESHVYAAFERTSGLQGVYVHDGREALHAACGAGHTLITRMLLHHPNVDVNSRSRGYQTALHLAAERGDVDMVDMILDFKRDIVDVNAMDGNGVTPLHDACRNGHRAVVDCLLSFPGIDVNVMTTRYHGEKVFNKRCGSGTPLHVACEYGHVDVVRLLLRHPEVDPALPTPWGGVTPLHVAAAEGLVEAVGLLLTCDAVEINAQQDDGSTAWDLAYKHHKRDVLDLLTPANASCPPCPEHLCACSAIELQDGLVDRYNRSQCPQGPEQGYPAVVRFQSSGLGYNPHEVLAIGDFNEWNICCAVPLFPVCDKLLGMTWIAVLELPPGENEVQLVIDGARGRDNTRKGHRTLEEYSNCNLVVSKPPFMPTIERSLEGTRIKHVPGHKSAVHAPLAPPAAVPAHTYLVRELDMILFSPPRPEEEPTKRQAASMGVEVKFFRGRGEARKEKVAIVVAMKPKGPCDLAGIKIDDIIVSVDGSRIGNKQILARIIGDHVAGDIIPLVIERDGVTVTHHIKLEAKDAMVRRKSWVGPKLAKYRHHHPLEASYSFYGAMSPVSDVEEPDQRA